MAEPSAPNDAVFPASVAQRYRVIEALGRGGMARVYRVVDEVTGRELALKQLLPRSDAQRASALALFEAEFHTLAQLSHPRVIEVYDYGVTESGPFYTMELLDGGDLYDRSPLPWREACALVYDVCSSLALLHSRRLVHRDISPRNVRCTRDGRAKLIDFGAMMPMGRSNIVAGTAAFVAPETLNRSALDGRADLFSLGGTLYYALTRHTPFGARSFEELPKLWQRRPLPPSHLDPQIPAALDALVLSLLSPDPAMRPRSAFELMQRLSAAAGLEGEEELVSQAYLSVPTLVAREGVVTALAHRIERASARSGSACLIRAENGLGRSRILDACVLEAKAQGAVVLRASAQSAAGEGFALARVLLKQLLESAGERALASARTLGLVDSAHGDQPIDAYQRLLLQLSKEQLLVIAVDDLQRCDEPSASLLAALAAHVEERRLCLLVTLDADAPQSAPEAIQLLAEYSTELALDPLTRDQTEELFSSVFGAVPNLGVLTEVVHELARGNPRKCLDVAQHLVDRGAVRYAAGSWTLPEQIDRAVLPRSAEEAMHARIARLDPLARWLAQTHALSLFDNLSRDDYAALRPDADHQRIDAALLQLISEQILASDGSRYSLARRGWAELLVQLDVHERGPQHAALARLYAERAPLAAVHHLLASDQRELGLARLLAFVESTAQDPLMLWERSSRMRPNDLAAMFERAHRVAVELQRPKRERVVTCGWIVGMSVIADDSYYFRFVDEWRTQLEHDSGLAIYRGLSEPDPNARLMRALTLVSERHAALPEAERVYAPEEAIRLLVSFVGVSIAIGSRSYSSALLAPLPGMLAPFAALSPVIEAIRLNAIASRDVSCSRLEQGRAGWREVYERLGRIDAAVFPSVATFRNAIAYAIGLVEARIGLESADEWMALLDRDPSQRVNALYLRKVTALHRGDFDAAERWRKQAEITALQTPLRQMFTNVVVAELWAHAAAGDLAGVKQALDRIAPLSERYPSWHTLRLLAEAQFQAIRGDLEAALSVFERCLALCSPDASDPNRSIVAWPSCMGSYVDTLNRLGRHEQARSVAEAALVQCAALEIGVSAYEITRGLALAEARLGDHASAWARLEQLIAAQQELGVKGLQLGATYDACARVAIWSQDIARLQHYAALTAREYRHGRGSVLGARYERLMDEARSAGLQALPELTEFVSTAMVVTQSHSREGPASHVLETMVGATDRKQRARRAIRMLCEARGARAGHLYLCAAGGIALVASKGGGKPPRGLRAYLAQYLQAEEEQYDSATTIATDAALAAAAPRAYWIDAHGNTHYPLVLTGELDGVRRPIGIASLIIDDPQQRLPAQPQLSTAIAEYLIEAGDLQELLGAAPTSTRRDSVAAGKPSG